MTPQFTLNPIGSKTKGEMKRLRLSGIIPVSIQHKGAQTLHFQQEERPLFEFIQQYGDAALLDLRLMPENKVQHAIVQTISRDAISGKLTQVVFRLLAREDTLKTHVSILFVGEPQAAQRGEAVVQHQRQRLDVECSQQSLPDHIVVDVSGLIPGDVVRVADLPPAPQYKITNAQDTVLASLTAYRTGGGATETTATAP